MAGLEALSLDGVSKHYGSTRALDQVSLRVARGEFLTLLGPSGSGKTTLLMAIAGFVAPTAGRILLNDRPIHHLPPEKRNFGMVFQGYALFPHLTVARNVAFPLEVRGLPRADIRQKVRQALDLVQLDTFADRLPRQLSGGQQQRVALARALVFAPHLLLLDEPLSALDRKLRADMQIELKSFHRQVGLTFIYVTHDQEEALSMSDRVAILRDGKLLQLGAPSELYERPTTRFVAEFLGKSNFLAGTVERRMTNSFAFRCKGQVFEQRSEAIPEVGQTVLVAVRPERIFIVGDNHQARNQIEGTIAEFSYLGTSFHLLADTLVGRLAVTVPTWRHGAPPLVGGKLRLSWDPDASIQVTDDGPAFEKGDIT